MPADNIEFEWEKKKNTEIKEATREDFERIKKEYGGQ